MKANLEGVRKNMFMMYPRFLQMIFDSRYPQLQKTVNILDMKPMAPNSFGMVKAVRKKSKTDFKGLHPLEKLGQFPETLEEALMEPPIQLNAEIAEEHAGNVEQQNEDDEIMIVEQPEQEVPEQVELEPIEPEQVATTNQAESSIEQPKQATQVPLTDLGPTEVINEQLEALLAKL